MTYKEINDYFKYYRYNESVFLESEKYLYFDVDNKNAYSFCFSNLLINICSDFESLSKKYYGMSKNNTIVDIIKKISLDSDFATFFNEKVSLIGTTYLNIEPLKNDGNTFMWWTNYNRIKHDKLSSIVYATQETIINALAALYILNMYILKAISTKTNQIDVFLNYNPIFVLSNLKSDDIVAGNNIILSTQGDKNE